MAAARVSATTGAAPERARLPNARLCVHPRGVRHLVDPSRLIAGTIAVYGEQHTRAVYGDILPVAEERIVVAEEGTTVELGARRLSFIDTPGHARHHVCVHDSRSNHFFAGDTFGLAYRELEVDGHSPSRQIAILNRLMELLDSRDNVVVRVIGPPRSICSRKSGTTLPLLASTFPNRTVRNRVGKRWAKSWSSSSAIRFETPRTLIGSTALSVEMRTTAPAPDRPAASATCRVPITLVLSASEAFRSSIGTCL